MKNKIISLSVLRTQSGVLGITRPVQLLGDITKSTDNTLKAKGNLKVIKSFEEAGAMGLASARGLVYEISKNTKKLEELK